MTATLSHQVTLTDDELWVLALRLGIHGLPAVLAVRPSHPTIDQRDLAYERASRELESRKLTVKGDVQLDLVSMLQALHRPDRELAMRLVTPDGMARVVAVRHGSSSVLARRIGDDISLKALGNGVELEGMASALAGELPKARPADIHSVGAPIDSLSECLSGTYDSADLADRIRAVGVESQAAMLLGAALASRQAFAEIVHYALDVDDGRISRSPAAVGVFYTRRGRIVSAPSASPSGQVWTTLRPGSDYAVIQAIGRLVELSNKEWGDS